MPIPQALREAKLWTLSGAKKLPYKPECLANNELKLGHSPVDNHLLVNYQKVKEYQEHYNFDNTLRPCIWIDNKMNFLFVDVEPEGAGIPNNPYLTLPYLYLERSRNGGYHGILPVQIPEKYKWLEARAVIKDPSYATEVFFDRHFMTFTEMEVKPTIPEGINNEDLLNLQLIRSQQLLDHITQLTSSENVTFSIEWLPEKELPNPEQLSAQEAKIYNNVIGYKNGRPSKEWFQPVDLNSLAQELGHNDLSRAETTAISRMAGRLAYYYPHLKTELGSLVKLLIKLTDRYLPDREKYASQRTVNGLKERVDFKTYQLLQAVNYLVTTKWNVDNPTTKVVG